MTKQEEFLEKMEIDPRDLIKCNYRFDGDIWTIEQILEEYDNDNSESPQTSAKLLNKDRRLVECPECKKTITI